MRRTRFRHVALVYPCRDYLNRRWSRQPQEQVTCATLHLGPICSHVVNWECRDQKLSFYVGQCRLSLRIHLKGFRRELERRHIYPTTIRPSRVKYQLILFFCNFASLLDFSSNDCFQQKLLFFSITFFLKKSLLCINASQ